MTEGLGRMISGVSDLCLRTTHNSEPYEPPRTRRCKRPVSAHNSQLSGCPSFRLHGVRDRALRDTPTPVSLPPPRQGGVSDLCLRTTHNPVSLLPPRQGGVSDL